MGRGTARLALVMFASVTAIACEGGGACEEDIRAQVLDQEAQLVISEQIVLAEIASTDVERERGWKHRRCDLEALLLVAPSSGELSIWGCGLTRAVDVLWIRNGQVIAIDGPIEPCAEPCDACVLSNAGSPVDAALEVPQGALKVSIGEVVEGLTPWIPGDQ